MQECCKKCNKSYGSGGAIFSSCMNLDCECHSPKEQKEVSVCCGIELHTCTFENCSAINHCNKCGKPFSPKQEPVVGDKTNCNLYKETGKNCGLCGYCNPNIYGSAGSGGEPVVEDNQLTTDTHDKGIAKCPKSCATCKVEIKGQTGNCKCPSPVVGGECEHNWKYHKNPEEVEYEYCPKCHKVRKFSPSPKTESWVESEDYIIKDFIKSIDGSTFEWKVKSLKQLLSTSKANLIGEKIKRIEKQKCTGVMKDMPEMIEFNYALDKAISILKDNH